MTSEKSVKVGMQPPHPGDFIRTEILDELGLSVAQAASILGVQRATLSGLLHGKTSLSPEMALRLEKAFAIPMETLLRLQTWYDIYTMRQQANEMDVQHYQPV